MTVKVDIPESELAAFEVAVVQKLQKARPGVLRAMRDRLYEIVVANFGIMGPDRPWHWAPLAESTKAAYRRRKPPVTRDYASLELTGAMKAAVEKGGVDGDTTSVELSDSSVPYATAHHDGTANMPARRVFPVDEGGEVLRWTSGEVQAAAEQELRQILNG